MTSHALGPKRPCICPGETLGDATEHEFELRMRPQYLFRVCKWPVCYLAAFSMHGSEENLGMWFIVTIFGMSRKSFHVKTLCSILPAELHVELLGEEFSRGVYTEDIFFFLLL